MPRLFDPFQLVLALADPHFEAVAAELKGTGHWQLNDFTLPDGQANSLAIRDVVAVNRVAIRPIETPHEQAD